MFTCIHVLTHNIGRIHPVVKDQNAPSRFKQESAMEDVSECHHFIVGIEDFFASTFKDMAHYKHLMTAPSIESSTREERLDYVLNEWRCLHNCEPMEQREQKPNLFGLCRVVTEEDEVKYAVNVMS